MMYLFRHDKQYKQAEGGFSLVELLVAVSIFAIVMLVAVGTLIVLIRAGNVAQSSQALSSNLSFALDSISRTIRTGFDYYCTDTPPGDGSPLPSSTQDCATGDGAKALIFTRGETGERIAYRYNDTDDVVEQKIEDGDWIQITSTDINIEYMRFIAEGSSQGDSEQPRIRVFFRGTPSDATLSESPDFYIQTTVTSRLLDV